MCSKVFNGIFILMLFTTGCARACVDWTGQSTLLSHCYDAAVFLAFVSCLCLLPIRNPRQICVSNHIASNLKSEFLSLFCARRYLYLWNSLVHFCTAAGWCCFAVAVWERVRAAGVLRLRQMCHVSAETGWEGICFGCGINLPMGHRCRC